MSTGTRTPDALYSDKHRAAVVVEYECTGDPAGRFALLIWPATPHPKDPPGEFLQATFVVEGEFVRGIALDRNHLESLAGVSHDLLRRVAAGTGRRVRSSRVYRGREEVLDSDDQLLGPGGQMWDRLVRDGRASYDEGERRYHLL